MRFAILLMLVGCGVAVDDGSYRDAGSGGRGGSDAAQDASIAPDAACDPCITEAGTPFNCTPIDPQPAACDPNNDQCATGSSCHQPCCLPDGCLGWVCACVGESCVP